MDKITFYFSDNRNIGKDDMIDYCLMSSEQYFSYMYEDNKFNIKTTIEMREWMDQPGQQLCFLLTEKVWRHG